MTIAFGQLVTEEKVVTPPTNQDHRNRVAGDAIFDLVHGPPAHGEIDQTLQPKHSLTGGKEAVSVAVFSLTILINY